MAFLALTIIIGLEGMHLAIFGPPGPLGGVRGSMGGQGGSLGQKIVNFLGAPFGFQIGKFWIV